LASQGEVVRGRAQPRQRRLESRVVAGDFEERRCCRRNVTAPLRRRGFEHAFRAAERTQQRDERAMRDTRDVQTHPGVGTSVDLHRISARAGAASAGRYGLRT
jgi:hypothetical protein